MNTQAGLQINPPLERWLLGVNLTIVFHSLIINVTSLVRSIRSHESSKSYKRKQKSDLPPRAHRPSVVPSFCQKSTDGRRHSGRSNNGPAPLAPPNVCISITSKSSSSSENVGDQDISFPFILSPPSSNNIDKLDNYGNEYQAKVDSISSSRIMGRPSAPQSDRLPQLSTETELPSMESVDHQPSKATKVETSISLPRKGRVGVLSYGQIMLQKGITRHILLCIVSLFLIGTCSVSSAMLIIGPLATTTVITSKDAFELRDVPLKGILPFVLMILITDRHLVPKVDLRERMKHLLAYSALSLSFAGFIIASIALRQRLGTPLEIVMSSIGLVMYPLTMIVISAIQFNRPIKRMLRDLQSAQRAASYFFTPNSDQTGSGKRGNIGVRFNRSEKYADDLHPKMMRYTEKNNPLQMLLATYNFVLAVTVILWVAAITVHILSEVRGARTAFERTIWSLILLLESSVESFVKLWADWNECSMSDVEDMSVDLTSNRPIERSESVQPELLRQPHTISTLGINSALTYVPHASGHVFNPSRRGSFLHSDRSVRGNSNIVIDEKLVSFELNGNGQSSSQTLDRSGAKISLESPLLTTSPYQLGNGRGEPSMGNSGPYLSPYQLVPTDRRRYIPSSPKPPRRISEGFQGDTYRD